MTALTQDTAGVMSRKSKASTEVLRRTGILFTAFNVGERVTDLVYSEKSVSEVALQVEQE